MPKDKRRRDFAFTGGGRIGSNAAYTNFSGSGRLTMAASATVYKDLWLPAMVWVGIEPNQWANAFNATLATTGSPSTARPFGINFGSAAGSAVMIPVLSASNGGSTDCRAATTFFAPPDAASSGSVALSLYYTTKVAMATTGSMDVWRVHYNYWGTGGSLLGGSSGSILYGASLATTGGSKLEVANLGNIPSFQPSSSPFVTLQLTLEGSNTCQMSGSAEEQVFGVRARYQSDSLGAQF